MVSVFKYLLGALFIAAGVAHFIKTELYLKAMPPYLPFPEAMVLISGAISAALGILLMVERTRRLAAWGIIAYLAAVFPANVYMAIHPEIFPSIPEWIYWARLPLQFVLVAWAATYRNPKEGHVR